MTIKQQGGIFGRNPSFNDVDAQSLSVDNDLKVNEDVNNLEGRINIYGNKGGSDTDAATLRFYNKGNLISEITGQRAGADDNGQLVFKTYQGGSSRLSMELSTNNDVLFYQNDGSTVGMQYDASEDSLKFVSGGGIDFSATSGTGTSELFDDYEEGTWTPTIAGDATGAFSTAEGAYTKIGRLVFIEMYVVISTNFTSNTIGGLPFTVGNLLSGTSFGQNAVVLTNAADTVTGAVQETTSDIKFYNDHSLLSAHNPNSTNDGYRLSLCYQA